nr:phosphoribosyl-ATP diphosphatase [Euzebyales bacterium]
SPGSYSATLLADPELARRKIMEEAFEVCLELGRTPVQQRRVAAEAADLVFHLLAGLVGAGVGWDAVLAELEERRG